MLLVPKLSLTSLSWSVQLLAFETYRDLVKLLQQNLTEEQGLIAAELRNIEERASARAAAAAAVGMQAGQNAAPASSGTPAGMLSFIIHFIFLLLFSRLSFIKQRWIVITVQTMVACSSRGLPFAGELYAWLDLAQATKQIMMPLSMWSACAPLSFGVQVHVRFLQVKESSVLSVFHMVLLQKALCQAVQEAPLRI